MLPVFGGVFTICSAFFLFCCIFYICSTFLCLVEFYEFCCVFSICDTFLYLLHISLLDSSSCICYTFLYLLVSRVFAAGLIMLNSVFIVILMEMFSSFVCCLFARVVLSCGAFSSQGHCKKSFSFIDLFKPDHTKSSLTTPLNYFDAQVSQGVSWLWLLSCTEIALFLPRCSKKPHQIRALASPGGFSVS